MFVERIDVRYDQSAGEHELTIKFLLPLVDSFFCIKGDRWAGRYDKEIILPPYQTIPQSRSSFDRGYENPYISLLFDLVLTSPSFWVSPYSNYQEFLSQTITKFRGDNMTYNQISKWLNDEGYKTPRGKRFSGNHIFSIRYNQDRDDIRQN